MENYSHDNLKAFIHSNKELFIDSLLKISVPDIEGTLSNVCQMVLQDNSARKEDLQAHAKGLKTLGNIFQTAKLQTKHGTGDSAPRLAKEEYNNYATSLNTSPTTPNSSQGHGKRSWIRQSMNALFRFANDLSKKNSIFDFNMFDPWQLL